MPCRAVSCGACRGAGVRACGSAVPCGGAGCLCGVVPCRAVARCFRTRRYIPLGFLSRGIGASGGTGCGRTRSVPDGRNRPPHPAGAAPAGPGTPRRPRPAAGARDAAGRGPGPGWAGVRGVPGVVLERGVSGPPGRGRRVAARRDEGGAGRVSSAESVFRVERGRGRAGGAGGAVRRAVRGTGRPRGGALRGEQRRAGGGGCGARNVRRRLPASPRLAVTAPGTVRMWPVRRGRP